MNGRAPVFIITGGQGQCKTTFLHQVLGLTVGANVRVRGIIAPGHVRDGRRSGFTLVDLATGEHEELCSIDPDPRCEVHGRFYFRPEALAFGRRALAPPDPRSTDLLVVDEVGHPHPPMIWTVRRRLLHTVVERWNIKNAVVVDVGAASVMATADAVMDAVWEWREAQAFSRVTPAAPQADCIPCLSLLVADAAAAGASQNSPIILRRCYSP